MPSSTFAAFWRHGSNVPLLVALAALGGAFTARLMPFAPAAVAIGALIFFVSEYTTHRFVLHAPPLKNVRLRALQARLHYDHHLRPAELDLLFLPLWFGIPLVTFYWLVYLALTHSLALAASMLCGSLAGLLYYEWVHYVAHVPFVPLTPLGKFVKKYHLRHHFMNERLWFGVTNPAGDLLGRTYARSEDAERSPHVKSLFPKA